MNLVERLRAHDMHTSPDWPDKAAMYAWMDQADKLMSEAAGEIERLQKEIETAREALEPFGWYREGFTVNFVRGADKPQNATSNTDEWVPLFRATKGGSE